MKKQLGFSVMLVSLLALGLILGGCPTESGSTKHYTVTFDANDGGDGSSVTNLPAAVKGVASGKTIAEPSPAPSRADYGFKGWYKEKEGKTAWNFASDMVTGDITLYASWKLNSYSVTFDGNGTGVTGLPAPISDLAKGAKINKPATDPSRGEDYQFGGWYKENTGTTAWNFTDDTVTRDTTLYAKWTKIKFTVSFDLGGISGTPPDSIEHVAAGSTLGTSDKPADPTDPEDYYAFDAWFDVPRDGSDEDEFVFADDASATPVTQDITLYAYWDKVNTDITFDVGSDDDRFDASNVENAPDPIYKKAIGAKLAAGDKPSDPSYAYGIYDFDGWFTDEACTNAAAFNGSTDITDDMVIYAKWTKAKAIVTFDYVNGEDEQLITAPSFKETLVNVGNKLESGNEPTPPSYDQNTKTFGGWFTDEACTGGAVAFDGSGTQIDDDITLYAKWD
jgi:uncharacterized repeat protein (TIGR02543 family)